MVKILHVGLALLLCLQVYYALPASSSAVLFENQNRNTEQVLQRKQLGVGVNVNYECALCFAALPLAKNFIIKNDTKAFTDIAILVCLALKIADDEKVCQEAIDLFQGPVLDVIVDTALNERELCSAFLDCEPVKNPAFTWNITLPDVPKPPVNPPVPPPSSAPKLKVLHLTDLHIDFLYQPGSLADCDQPLCCRAASTSKNHTITPERKAGYWGDYRNCDIPVWTLENMFEHIASNEEFDIVYWTGDLPPHNIWDQTKSDQLNALKMLTTIFQQHFPNKMILPSLGNHEGVPVNLFPTPIIKEDNTDWLYSELARDWTQTGLPESLAADILKGAFYTIQIRPGLRVISLNMNYCPSGNFWLFINSTDPLGQLDWLAKTLQQSENIGEKVHILGHIHPSGCMDSWGNNYYRIVNRYESTIAGQFFGHSHSDEFELFYDLDDLKRATGIAYIPGSATTYSYLNPGYRIYTIDGERNESTWQVLDFRNVYMNLTEANLSLKPVWRDEYSPKEAFGMPSVYAQDWSDLINKMLGDLNGPLVDKLLLFNSKSADVPINCDTNCRKNFVCGYKQAGPRPFIPC